MSIRLAISGQAATAWQACGSTAPRKRLMPGPMPPPCQIGPLHENDTWTTPLGKSISSAHRSSPRAGPALLHGSTANRPPGSVLLPLRHTTQHQPGRPTAQNYVDGLDPGRLPDNIFCEMTPCSGEARRSERHGHVVRGRLAGSISTRTRRASRIPFRWHSSFPPRGQIGARLDPGFSDGSVLPPKIRTRTSKTSTTVI